MSDAPAMPRPAPMTEAKAQLHPDKPAAIGPGRVLTWKQLHENSTALAKGLYGLGLRPGDKATVMIYNLPEYYEITAALSLIGVSPVMVGYRNMAPEIEYITENSDAKCLLFFHEFADRILGRRDHYPGLLPQGLVSVGPEPLEGAVPWRSLLENPPDVDLKALPATRAQTMIYTSGTTGRPKGAARTRNTDQPMVNYALHVIQQFKFDANEVHLVACPLYHSAPFLFSTCAYVLGGTLVLMRRFDPLEFLKNIDRYGVTSSFVVPTILDSLAQLPEEALKGVNLSSLRALICGGAPLFPQVKLEILRRFGPVLYEFYGSTETAMNTVITPEEIPLKPTSVGRPFFDNELKILDDEGNEVPDGQPGELYMYSSFLIDGYYKNEQATRESFRGKYMSVGDVAVRDAEGYYYIVDRKKDMIIRGGVNIYPAEVEAVLSEMPGIRDVAVVGRPDSHWGETVAAFVVLEPDASLDQEAVQAFCADKMANYKIPERVLFRSEIPRTPTGKVLKRDLRGELGA